MKIGAQDACSDFVQYPRVESLLTLFLDILREKADPFASCLPEIQHVCNLLTDLC